MWSVQLVVGCFETRLGGSGREFGGRLPAVQDRRVIELLEGVHVELPIRLDFSTIRESFGEVAERIAIECGHHRTEEICQRLLRLLREVDEDEAGPHLAVHGNQAVGVLVEVEELLLLLHEGQRAVQAVTPSVVLAGELAARP